MTIGMRSTDVDFETGSSPRRQARRLRTRPQRYTVSRNPHRAGALNTRGGVRRSFLPSGLCDTCPPIVAARGPVARAGQVSHNPEEEGPQLAIVCARGNWAASEAGRLRAFAGHRKRLSVGPLRTVDSARSKVASWPGG